MKTDFTIFKGITNMWWVPMITGVVAVLLGIWCLAAPATSLPFMAYLFAACFAVAGILNISLGFVGMKNHFAWGWTLGLGLLELVCGVWMFCLPIGQLTETFILIVGIWILVAAINAVCESFVMSSSSKGWLLWSILLLVATIYFAIVFLSNPILGNVAVWMWIGFSLICFGSYRMTFGWRVHNATKYL